jgi:hypothetical protein
MPSFSIRAYLPWSFHRDYRVSPFSASQLALAPTRTYKRRSTALQDHVSPVTKQTMAHPTSTADDVPLSQRLDGPRTIAPKSVLFKYPLLPDCHQATSLLPHLSLIHPRSRTRDPSPPAPLGIDPYIPEVVPLQSIRQRRDSLK